MNDIFEAKIPFENNALVPFLSEEELYYHYEKHHKGYANALNSLVEGTAFAEMNLLDVIKSSRNANQKIFNNASQIYNHDFYWKCLTTKPTSPKGTLRHMIDEQFGTFDNFVDQYIDFAGRLFGSGWSWIVEECGKLSFLNTSNAENPVGSDKTPVCVIDLWEHAYYIDYKNDRTKYINTIVKNCINWDFCSCYRP